MSRPSGPVRFDTLAVMVLDDHRFMQQVMRMLLVGLGVKTVVAASTVDEAITKLDADRFDLVFADYRLGGASGADFTRLARASRSGSDRFIPIIACTADTTPAVVRELRDAGVDEILGKPVSAQAIWRKLTAVVNSRRSFVAAPDFFGPDRRRRTSDPVSVERRRGGR